MPLVDQQLNTRFANLTKEQRKMVIDFCDTLSAGFHIAEEEIKKGSSKAFDLEKAFVIASDEVMSSIPNEIIALQIYDADGFMHNMAYKILNQLQRLERAFVPSRKYREHLLKKKEEQKRAKANKKKSKREED